MINTTIRVARNLVGCFLIAAAIILALLWLGGGP